MVTEAIPYRPKRGQDATDEPLHPDAQALVWTPLRNPDCTDCGNYRFAGKVCMMGNGPVPSAAMVVSDAPTPEDDIEGTPGHGDGLKLLDSVFAELGIDTPDVYLAFATKCRPAEGSEKKPSLKIARKACAPYLAREIAVVKPRAILAMGAEAYYHFAHKEGITKNRGQAFQHPEYGCWVIPTLSPLAVMIQPSGYAAFVADVSKWWRIVQGNIDPPKVDIMEVHSLDDLDEMLAWFAEDPDRLLTFDLETRGFNSQRDDYSFIWCYGVTDGRDVGAGMRTYLVPFEHADSPWYGDQETLRTVLEKMSTLLLGHTNRRVRVNGHNVKFDLRWLQRARERYGLTEAHA